MALSPLVIAGGLHGEQNTYVCWKDSSGGRGPLEGEEGGTVLLGLFIFNCCFPSAGFFFPTVWNGDPVTHTCTHSIFAHYHAPS